MPVPATVPDPPPDTVTVHAAPRTEDTTATSVSSSEARLVPGTEGDSLKVVQMLPGVARPAFGTGQLVVWGAAPQDTRVYVDGVQVPSLYHLGGLRSILPSDLVRDVTLVPGAYGADYGRALGGTARVDTRALPTEGTHGYVAADTLDGSAMVSAAPSERVRVAVAGRFGWIDRVLSAVSAPDTGDFYPVPRYGDWQAVTQIALRKTESVKVVLLGVDDALTRTIPSSDPGSVRTQTSTQAFQRLYAVYARTFDDGSAVRVTPFVGHDASRQEDRFGGQPDHLDQASFVYGVRASERMPLGPHVAFTTGIDVLGRATELSRAGSLTIPPREGDVIAFGQPPGSDYAVDSWSVHELDAAPHATADVTLGPVVVSPGVRFDAFLVEGSRSTPRIGQTPAVGFERLEGVVDPRVSARYSPVPRITWTAAAGTYHQPPAPEDLSAVFGTPALSYSSATHLTAGQTLHVTDTLDAEVVGFYEALSDLPVRSRLTTPRLALALVQNGVGRSYGAQLVVRQRLWHGFFGWITWSMTRSERQYAGDAAWRLFDYDQTHVVSVVASQSVGTWTFGARLRAATGLPRTPVVGALYDSRDDVYQPLFGAQNSIRLPAYWQLDVRVEKAFRLAESMTVKAYLEVLDVTDRANAEELAYSADWSRQGYVTGLPTVAVVGARAEF